MLKSECVVPMILFIIGQSFIYFKKRMRSSYDFFLLEEMTKYFFSQIQLQINHKRHITKLKVLQFLLTILSSCPTHPFEKINKEKYIVRFNFGYHLSLLDFMPTAVD